MKAVICTKYGKPDVLQMQDVPKPMPKSNEVLIKIHATTAHIGDTRVRGFKVPRAFWIPARLALGILRPRKAILGMELAGVVEAVGDAVTQFKAGDEVFAMPGASFGAYAEYITMPEDGIIVSKPDNMSFDEAAAIPAGALTALKLIRKANIQVGQSVLIYGASGSVGTYAVQLARYYGAQVTGVCSTKNIEMVKSLGAVRVIDYTQDDIRQEGAVYDVVLDAVAKLPVAQGKQLVKQGGVYLNVHKDTGNDNPVVADLHFLKERVEAGDLFAVIDRRYTLDDIVEAHRYVEQGHKKGNVLVSVVKA
jgi:NADPH:quinone reductase-like Zn-dependent oxidoreductase